MNPGDQYTYAGPVGLASVLLGVPLPAEMAELDLHPGTPVAVRDVEADLVHVEWVDRSGNPRATSVSPGDFAAHFEEA